MDFLELADRVEHKVGMSGSADQSTVDPVYAEVIHSAMTHVLQTQDSDDGNQVSDDEVIATVMALGANADGNYSLDDEDFKESEDDKNQPLSERIVRWFIKKMVKKVTLTGARVIIESLYSIVRWFAKEVVVRGLQVAAEFVLRNLVVDGIAFIVADPVLLAGVGVAALGGIGWLIYKRFFDEHAADVQEAQIREAAAREEREQEAEESQPTTTQVTARQTTSAPIAQPAPEQPAASPVQAQAPRPQQPLPPPVIVPGSSLEQIVKPMIVRHEGRGQDPNRPYRDSRGLWTVGIGHLIGNGRTLPDSWNRRFSEQEIDELFSQDFTRHLQAAQTIPNFDRLNVQGQAALVDITFNMGPVWWLPHTDPSGHHTNGFPRFTRAMQDFDVGAAITSLQNSAWYSQVGNRSREDLDLLRTNVTPAMTQPSPSTTTAHPTTAAQRRAQQQRSQTAGSSPAAPSTDSTIITGPGGQPMRIN